MRFWITLCFAALMALVACSKEEQAADSRARVHFDEDSLVSHEWVHLILEDGKTVWDFGPENLMVSPLDTSLFATPEVQTQANGTLRLTFRLVTEEDSLFSDGMISAPLSPNWTWSFELVRAPVDPPLACDDCWRVSEFEIYDPTYADERIFVLWRGGGTGR